MRRENRSFDFETPSVHTEAGGQAIYPVARPGIPRLVCYVTIDLFVASCLVMFITIPLFTPRPTIRHVHYEQSRQVALESTLCSFVAVRV
jgi:hypothetical protein